MTVEAEKITLYRKSWFAKPNAYKIYIRIPNALKEADKKWLVKKQADKKRHIVSQTSQASQNVSA